MRGATSHACARADHVCPRGPGAARPALVDTAGGVACPTPGGAAAGHLPAHRPVRPVGRLRVRVQGDPRADRRAGVRPAPGPGADRLSLGRGGGGRRRPADRGRGAARIGADHPAPAVLAAVPGALLAHPSAGDDEPAARRARRPDRADAPDRLLLGRLLAVEHAVPAGRGRLRRLPGGRGDGCPAQLALQRSARRGPGDRPGEHLRRGAGPAGRRPAARVHRPGGGLRGGRAALRAALARDHLRAGDRAGGPARHRGPDPPPQRAGLRRRRGGHVVHRRRAVTWFGRRSSTPATTPGGCCG